MGTSSVLHRTASACVAMAMSAAVPAFAADWYAAPGGNNANSCQSTAAPCKTIQAAINKAGANDTVHVGQGSYPWAGTIKITTNGLKLIGDNSPFAAASTPGNVAPAANASELSAASSSGTGMIWIAGAQDVDIENLLLQVNHGNSNEGIVTTGNANGLILRNNYLRINASYFGKRNAISLNMAAGSGSDQNSTGAGPSGPIYVTLDGNVVQPATNSQSAISSRAIVGDTVAGVFAANQVAGSTQDIRLRFMTAVPGRGAGLDVDGNYVYAAGLWLMSPNDLSASVHIHDNSFIAPGAPGGPASPFNASSMPDPDFSSLKLVGGSNPNVVVENNTFTGYANFYRGIWVQNWTGVTIQDNTFTPNTTYNGWSTAVLVGNKEAWNGTPAPRQLAVTMLRNTFNAGYTNANSRAVVFIDDNDASGAASAGTLAVGDGTAANANSFAAGLKWYVGLDEHTCDATNCSNAAPTNSPLGPGINYTGSSYTTQWRPFRFDVGACGNYFAGKLVANMTQAEYNAIAGHVYDKADNSALGTVNYCSLPIQTGTIVFSPTSFTYDGNAHAITATLQEDASAVCVVTPASVTNAGDTPVSATCTNAAYNVTGSGTVHVDKAAGTVTWGTLSFVYDGTTPTVTATLTQEGSACTVTGTVGPNAGSYPVHADCSGTNYTASADTAAQIAQAAGTVTWGTLSFGYDGTTPTVTATLTQDGSACTVTGAVGPNAGSYPVHADCSGTNYTASANDTAQVAKAASQTALSTSCMLTFVEAQPFTLSGTVSGVNGVTGNVTFDDGAGHTQCNQVALIGNAATCTTSALATDAGVPTAYQLGAQFSGDANHQSSAASVPIHVLVLSAQDVVFRDGFEAVTLDCPLQ
ncbi:MAG: Ig-like domain repeat protein [Proteobacteria bacterium]|nr:Ig-like domain repeat protein [Pseudomonadota bacterium]